MSETTFELNCQRWSLFDPKTAAHLATLQFAPLQTEDSLNDWFSKLDLSGISVLFVYGVGLGAVYDVAKNWLTADPQRALVLLEDDLGVLYNLLHTKKATELLHDSQVRLAFVDNDQMVLYSLAGTFAIRHFSFQPTPGYLKTKGEKCNELSSRLRFFMDMKMALPREFGNHGAKFFANYYRNLLKMQESAYGNKLFNQFTDVPAIICGAGPSLTKDLELITTLKNRALIFASGTAMNALNSVGFLPHFGVTIDPNTAQFTRLIMNQAFTVPYFYRNRASTDALDLIHGTHLYMTGTPGYPITNWIEGKLGIVENNTLIEEGFGVINFTIAIAKALGCNPIILTGVDLAYSDEKSYANGIHNHPIHPEKEFFVTKSAEEDVIQKKDIHGKDVTTLWKWVAEALFIANYSQKIGDTSLVNATDGGIGFHPVPNIPLATVVDNLLQKQYDLDGMIFDRIQKAQMPASVTEPAIIACMQELLQSMTVCQDLCHTLILEYQALEQQLHTDLSDTANQAVIALTKEPAYTYILATFSERYLELHKLNLETLIFDADKLSAQEIARRKARINTKRYNYLQETARVNIEILQKVLLSHNIQTPQNNAIEPHQELTPDINPYQNSTVKHEYYSDGQIALTQYFQDGLLHGPSTYFTQTGRCRSRHLFVHGKLEGEAVSYSDEGMLLSRQRYTNGKLDGLQETFYTDGTLKSAIPYKNGLLHGVVRLFYANGSIKRMLQFVHGKRQGKEQIWNSQNRLVVDAEFADDLPVKTARQWHNNGKLALEVIYDSTGKYTMRQWDEEGHEQKPEQNTSGDYFEQATNHTTTLTELLSQMVKQIASLEAFANTIQHENGQNTEQLDIIRKDLDHVKSISAELTQMNEGTPGQEALWKGPHAHRLIEQQMQLIVPELTKKIQSVQFALTKIAATLSKKLQ
ncbi:MAG: DUF115 domain-containing protein [Chlamydiales bacterium]|nr:DUF115 domain-containing protein [Chlamydiales bacterium]